MFNMKNFLHAIAFIAMLASGSSNAALFLLNDTVGDFTDGTLDNGDSFLVDAITLTFSNITGSDGSNSVQIDSDGIFLSLDPGEPDAISFDISFDTDVLISQYGIGFTQALAGDEILSLTGANGTSGNNAVDIVGDFTFDAGSISVFLANQSYTLTHTVDNDPSNDLSQLIRLNVTAASAQVPSPTTALLLLIGLVGVARSRNTSHKYR